MMHHALHVLEASGLPACKFTILPCSHERCWLTTPWDQVNSVWFLLCRLSANVL